MKPASSFRVAASTLALAGGTVDIVEVATPHEGWQADTHRLNRQVVIDDSVGGGFELVEESDLLANPDDDYSADGFPNRLHDGPLHAEVP